jgi:hypothetical protein
VDTLIPIDIGAMERLPASRTYPCDIVPLPNCSHYIIFEGGRREYELYEKLVKQRVPAGLIMVNGEPASMKTALNNLRYQLPTIIFHNSGGAASVMGAVMARVDELGKE